MSPVVRFAAAAALLCAACADDKMSQPDARTTIYDDATVADASIFPLAGFGQLSGDCNLLDDELTSPSPALFRSAIDFALPYTKSDLSQLTPGGQEIIADDNLGGSSLLSEVFAYELLARCEGADLLKTEGEVVYDIVGKVTDLLVDIDGVKIGVSVTRAVGFPFDDPYSVDQARTLLADKLGDILMSSANVSAEDRWQKQILAVLAYAPGHADSLVIALADIAAATFADTIVWVLVSDGADDFIYCDGPCP